MKAVIGALRVVLGADTVAFEKGLNAAQKRLNRFGREMGKIGNSLTSIGTNMTVGITLPIVALGTAMTKTAIDAAEMQSAFDVSFGSMAKSAKTWAETTGDALDRSTTEMQTSMLAMHGLFKAGGPATEQTRQLAEQFTVLGQDLSSFHNIAGKDVMAALKSGLSGEAEPMRRFNVYLNEGAVKAQALKMGLKSVNGEFSETAKIQARAALIMAGTTEAQGDVARTSTSAANQIRAAQSAWQELSVTLGTKIIPLLTPIVEKIAAMLNSFGKLSPQLQNTIMIGAGLVAVLGPLAAGIGALITGISALAPVLGAAAGALAAIGAPVILPIAAAVAGLAVVFLLFRKQIIPVLQDFGKTIATEIGPKIAPLLDAAGKAFTALMGVVGPMFKPGGQFGQAMAVFLNLTTRTFNAIVAIVGVAVDLLTASLKIVTAMLKGDWGAAFKGALSLITIFQGGVVKVFAALAPEVIAWVKKLWAGVKEWLVDRFADVAKAVGEKVAAVTGFFKDMWDAVVGHSYVPDMVEGIAHWFGKLDAGMVRPADNATDAVKQAFEDLRDDIAGIWDGLLTDSERALGQALWENDRIMAAVDKGMLLSEAAAMARRRDEKSERDNFRALDPNYSPDLNPGLSLPGALTDEQVATMQGQIADAWNGAIDAVRQGGMKGLFAYAGERFGDILTQRAVDALTDLTSQFLQLMQQSQAANGNGGGWGAVISGAMKLFGFKTGGSFKVGGSGGADSKLVAFKATPGEMVNVSHGNDNGGGGGAFAVHVKPSPMFEVEVSRVATNVAAPMASAAYTRAVADAPRNMQRQSRSRLG